jgi:hypothetical protein
MGELSRQSALDRAHDRAAARLLDARGAVYEAFDSLGLGVTAEQMREWFMESPGGQRFGDDAGFALGAALGTAIVAVELDREGRRDG